MRRTSAVILLLLVALLAPVVSSAQKVGTTSFQFLKVAPGSRAAGMGGAATAAASGSSALFQNPAGIGSVEHLAVSLDHIDWFIDTRMSSVAAAYTIYGLGTFGLQLNYADYGSIEVTRVSDLGWQGDGTYNPGLTGESLSPHALVGGLSYSRLLTDKFTFGLTAKYVREDLGVEQASAVAFDGGLIYDTGFRSLTVGAALLHFGPEVRYINESFPLPQTFVIGVSGSLVGPNALILDASGYEVSAAYDLVHPRDYAQQHRLGMEVVLMDRLFLRSGYRFNYDEESIIFGAGLALSYFQFDYAYDPFGDYLSAVHRFSVGFDL